MASLAAAEVAAAEQYQVQLFTFGSPRVGDKAWSEWAQRVIACSRGAASLRMRRQLDIVPALPPRSLGVRRVEFEPARPELLSSRLAATSQAPSRTAFGLRPGFRLSGPKSHLWQYEHLPTEVWNRHTDDGRSDTYVLCDGSGEDPTCGDSEEKPFFPADLLHLKPYEHTRYMGFQGGRCRGG